MHSLHQYCCKHNLSKTRKLMPVPASNKTLISQVQYCHSCSVHMAAASEYSCFICNAVSMNYMLWNLATHLAKLKNITPYLASSYADVLTSSLTDSWH